MATTKFVQVLRVEDFRLESGASVQPRGRGSSAAVNVVRIWLYGSPATPFSKVTHARLEARSDTAAPSLPGFDFQRRRIVIPYTTAAIQPVVSLLLDGVQVYCQYREFDDGSVQADVHVPRTRPPPDTDPHWTDPAG